MKALIVAHPDDEIIWFSPQHFDLIVIAFLARHDKPFAEYCRTSAIKEHPLKNKITLLNIQESGYWKDKRRVYDYKQSRKILFDSLILLKKNYTFSEIYTHNSKGEYGHDDHILVNEAVTSIFGNTDIYCPTDSSDVKKSNIISISNDIPFYQKTKKIYIKNKAWTWKSDYTPPTKLLYSRHMNLENDNY